jgi:predicted acylesterase/phospholipase RssA
MRILSIDGGGIRGLIPAVVLCELESRAGRPAAELFDLMAGTSTGGIIACALAKGMAAEDIVPLYLEEGPRIFRRSLGRRLGSADGLLDEKHDDTELEAALGTYLGDTTLGEARVDVLVTAYDLHERAPHIFKSWREEWRDVRMADAARATSAAPTYFEPYLLGERSLVDGGVFATNPAMCAYAEAARLQPGAEVRLVALGTGRLTKRIEHDDAKDWGLVEWVRPVIDVVFDGVADAVDYQLEHVLGDRHHRFQVTLGERSNALDDASAENLERLHAHARALVDARSADLDELVMLLDPG